MSRDINIRNLLLDIHLEGAITWQSKLQKNIVVPTIEAIYYWNWIYSWYRSISCKIKNFLNELSLNQGKYILQSDSRSAINLSLNAAYQSRTKYTDVRFHWIRDISKEKIYMQVIKIPKNRNLSYIMRKSLLKKKNEHVGD